MQGTVEFELKPLLDLEMEFNHIPGLPRTGIDYPPEDPTYEIERIRVFYQEKMANYSQVVGRIYYQPPLRCSGGEN